MSKLIYCSYSLMDADGRPSWLDKLRINPVCLREHWAFYDPMLGFTGNIESDPYLAAAMSDNSRLRTRGAQNMEALRLDPALLLPLPEVHNRLRQADSGPSVDVAFKNIYVLLRSDLVLVDLNAPSHGETAQEVLYAYLFGVPVVGIAHRFILSPWVVGKVKAVIFPSSSDDIVHQILAQDTATAAYISSMRAELDKAVAETEKLKEKERRRMDGRTPVRERLKTKPQPAVEGGNGAADESAPPADPPVRKDEDGDDTGASTI